MKRVVVTGLGLVTPLGNDEPSIIEGLQNGVSAVTTSPEYRERGFACQVWAQSSLSQLPPIDRKIMRHMGKGETLLLGYHAAVRAVADAGLTVEDLRSEGTGCILGTGGPSTKDQCDGANGVSEHGSTRRLSPRIVTPTMSSGLNAVSSTFFGVEGETFSISSACATSLICIGEAAKKIELGEQEMMLAGGGDDNHWTKACGFDSSGALVRGFNDNPAAASRPFDKDRAGFVDASGAGVFVLEELEHALARGARIRAEVVGYGNRSDGDDMTVPSGVGAERCMRKALRGFDGRGVGRIDHIVAHATSTPIGDLPEVRVIAKVFGDEIPWITAPKGNIGHTLGGAGGIASGFGVLSIESGFIPKCVNIDTLDPEIEALGLVGRRIARETISMSVERVMVNAFGFGGTNACVIFQRYVV